MPSETSDTSRDASAKKPDDAALEERLSPIEDFQDRAESWMKEITSQVARLASGSESDTRRREALDKRLGDIEQRIQSLLTLTEMISMNENPFISGKEGGGGGGEAPAQSQPEAAAQPQEQSLYAAEPPQQPPSPPQPAARPSDPPPAPAPAPSSHPNDAHAETDQPARPAPTATPTAAEEPRPATTGDGTSHGARHDAARQPGPTATTQGRAPEAAPGETAEHARRLGPFVPVDDGPTPSEDSARADVPDPGRRAADRIFTLEWADMLAKNLPRSEIPDFLDRYVEAGWVGRDMATSVRALALGLTQKDPDHPDQARLHELHLRTTVLLSHLDGIPLPAQQAMEVLGRARELTSGEWIE